VWWGIRLAGWLVGWLCVGVSRACACVGSVVCVGVCVCIRGGAVGEEE